MKEFDVLRAAFCLVAFVIAAIVFIVVGSVTVCWYHADAIVAGRFRCDVDDRLGTMLTGALAAAIALLSMKATR